jgi:hypothetical protein
VGRVGAPYKRKGITADITPLKSPDSDDSVAANASGDSDSFRDSDRDRNYHTIVQKWKASGKRVILCLVQKFINRVCKNRKKRMTHRYSDSVGDGHHKW